MARIKHPNRSSGVSFEGKTYSADANGIIEVPAASVADFIKYHKFQIVPDAPAASAINAPQDEPTEENTNPNNEPDPTVEPEKAPEDGAENIPPVENASPQDEPIKPNKKGNK